MRRLIDCRQAVRRLWHFLDGELEPEDQAQVEEHLEHCVQCCGELEFADELRGLLAAQQTDELPDEVRDRLDQFVEDLTDPREGHQGGRDAPSRPATPSRPEGIR